MIDRRKFLELGGMSVTAALLAACDSMGPAAARGFLKHAESRNEGVERLLLRHSTRDVPRASARPAGRAFPSYFVSDDMPIWDPAVRGAWTLQVDGAVRKPMRLTLDQLAALPRHSQTVDHYCVEGWNAVAKWTGARMSDLARVVQPTSDAQYVDFASFDSDYHESWDMESAMHPQTLVAYAMDGHWLGANHGAPARVHSPVKLGYKNTKYLVRVTFMPTRNGGYWSDRGYEWFGGT
ncbi:MAG TPA: molybdopterin-dependent oxidoreductase [Gemmatimonadaceae bacterium]|nr:molybdopterin-dependent oxidoreductase [Gemmatimonadaceae bacterium]